jgi:hypothetical protein
VENSCWAAQFTGLPFPPRCFRPRARPTKETSDAPCRAPTYVSGSRPTPSSRNQNRFYRPRVNASGFPGSERLPSPSARTSLSGSPSPPPIARLCRRAPASDAASPPRRSRAGGLDLDHGFPRRSSRQGWFRPRAARRLLQSWSDLRARPRIVRTPRTALPVARVRSFFSRVAPRSFRRRGQPGGIGPGAAQLDVTPSAWRPSKRSLACEGLAPTQIDPDTPCRGLVTSTAGVSPSASGAR